jgi:hypothetical protein
MSVTKIFDGLSSSQQARTPKLLGYRALLRGLLFSPRTLELSRENIIRGNIMKGEATLIL